MGSGLRSRRLALSKDNAWWGSSVSTARAGPYRKALAREQEIKGVPAIEGMPAEVQKQAALTVEAIKGRG